MESVCDTKTAGISKAKGYNTGSHTGSPCIQNGTTRETNTCAASNVRASSNHFDQESCANPLTNHAHIHDDDEARTGLLECPAIGPEDANDEPEIEETKAPDGGWGWCIILGCLILRMIIGGIIRSHGLFFKRFIERFQQSATATAWVTSLSGTVRLGTGPVVSIMCNRFSGRILVSIGTVLYCIALFMTAFAPNQPFLYFSYGVVGGLGRSFILTPCPILLGYYFDKRRSLAFGLAAAGFSLGGFAITPLVELMFQSYGFTGTFIALSGMATQIFMCACLFRPIELHRRLSRKKSNKHILEANTDRFPKAMDKMEIVKQNGEQNSLLGEDDHDRDASTNERLKRDQITVPNTQTRQCDQKEVHNGIDSVRNSTISTGNNRVHNMQKKKKLISLSILKDIRFLTFLFALFFNSLPSSGLFLPSLAISRGLSEFEAASLISISAGMDTVFRVLAGFVLDMKIFRKRRPIIFNVMTFIHSATVLLKPSAESYGSFIVLMCLDGAVQGVKNAQRSVVMVDLLGLDKLASSMALSMCAQAAGILLGPTISGLLKDIYGTYDGAFYFGGSAIFAGALIMAGGNIRKIYLDREEKRSAVEKDVHDKNV